MSRAGATAYAESGVSLAAADGIAARLRTRLAPAAGSRRVELLGGYAGGIEVMPGLVLAASCDGAGTKIDLCRRHGQLRNAGIDIVAMCANDLACTGVTPSMFVDYVAAHTLDPAEVDELVAGIETGCGLAGCELVGGETAELGAMLGAGALDGAGTCIGVAERSALLSADAVQPGDRLVAIASAGIHANGFTLVRRLLDEDRLALTPELLVPTRMYVELLAELRRAQLLRAAAHITGGGIPGNLPRVLAPGCAARIDLSSWKPAMVFAEIAEALRCSLEEILDVFNMGVGMIVVCGPGAEQDVCAAAADAGFPAWQMGDVVAATGGSPICWAGRWEAR